MANLFASLGLKDTDRVFNATTGQEVVYQIANEYVAMQNQQLDRQLATFVEQDTSNHTLRYRLPGGGFLPVRGAMAPAPDAKAVGSWDVAFPLDDFGVAITADFVTRGYMTAAEMTLHINNAVQQNVNTVRFQMLKALFNNTAATFVDPLWGNLTIQRLANGDSTLYPPVLGSYTEATDNHYLESGYAASAISNTNNPFPVIRDEIEEHFGAATGGENIVVFVNNAQRAVIEALSSFTEVPDQFIRVGDDTDVPQGLPNVPGRILGRADGCWVVEWRYIPANYAIGVHLEVPKPLMRRVDPADTGLGTGLRLVASDERFPLETMTWVHRFGLGVANRLNGVVMEFGDGGSYTVPTAFA